jgi:large subunit ribosomal protein LP1
MSAAAPTNPELAVSYAALILADSSVTITSEKLQALLAAAKITDVEPIWTTLFSKALEGKDVKDIVTAVAASGPAIEVKAEEKKVDDGGDEDVDADAGEKLGDSDEEDGFGFDLFG